MSITKQSEIGADTGEYAKWVVIKGNLEAKARVFNTVLPAADNDILGSDITPTESPSYIRIYFVSEVAGVLKIARTVGVTTVVESLNSGNALVADAAYQFTVPWRTGDSINIRYSGTGANVLTLDIIEVSGVE